LRDKTKWWPKVVEVLAEIRAHLPPAAPTRAVAVPEVDLTPEEVKRRVEALVRIKRQYGYSPEVASKAPVLEPRVFDVPVSDVSDALRAVLRKQRGG
jgi:hypothetical protein